MLNHIQAWFDGTPLFPVATAFTRAAAGQQLKLPTLALLGSNVAPPHTERQARRIVERWETMALAAQLLQQCGVTSAYALEKKLVNGSTSGNSGQPRLFHRMLLRGEPAARRQLTKPKSLASVWIRKALEHAPRALEVLDDPIWRLLDPTPLSKVEWSLIAEQMFPEISKRAKNRVHPTDWMIVTSWVMEGAGGSEPFVPRADPFSLWGFRFLLLNLRRCELQGQLAGYYLNLLEAFVRCTEAPALSQLAQRLPGCAQYLSVNFGTTHIYPCEPDILAHEVSRLRFARAEFARQRSLPSVPDIEVVNV